MWQARRHSRAHVSAPGHATVALMRCRDAPAAWCRARRAPGASPEPRQFESSLQTRRDQPARHASRRTIPASQHAQFRTFEAYASRSAPCSACGSSADRCASAHCAPVKRTSRGKGAYKAGQREPRLVPMPRWMWQPSASRRLWGTRYGTCTSGDFLSAKFAVQKTRASFRASHRPLGFQRRGHAFLRRAECGAAAPFESGEFS